MKGKAPEPMGPGNARAFLGAEIQIRLDLNVPSKLAFPKCLKRREGAKVTSSDVEEVVLYLLSKATPEDLKALVAIYHRCAPGAKTSATDPETAIPLLVRYLLKVWNPMRVGAGRFGRWIDEFRKEWGEVYGAPACLARPPSTWRRPTDRTSISEFIGPALLVTTPIIEFAEQILRAGSPSELCQLRTICRTRTHGRTTVPRNKQSPLCAREVGMLVGCMCHNYEPEVLAKRYSTATRWFSTFLKHRGLSSKLPADPGKWLDPEIEDCTRSLRERDENPQRKAATPKTKKRKAASRNNAYPFATAERLVSLYKMFTGKEPGAQMTPAEIRQICACILPGASADWMERLFKEWIKSYCCTLLFDGARPSCFDRPHNSWRKADEHAVFFFFGTPSNFAKLICTIAKQQSAGNGSITLSDAEDDFKNVLLEKLGPRACRGYDPAIRPMEAYISTNSRFEQQRIVNKIAYREKTHDRIAHNDNRPDDTESGPKQHIVRDVKTPTPDKMSAERSRRDAIMRLLTDPIDRGIYVCDELQIETDIQIANVLNELQASGRMPQGQWEPGKEEALPEIILSIRAKRCRKGQYTQGFVSKRTQRYRQCLKDAGLFDEEMMKCSKTRAVQQLMEAGETRAAEIAQSIAESREEGSWARMKQKGKTSRINDIKWLMGLVRRARRSTR